MQELLQTLTTNPYTFIILLTLILSPIGLLLSWLALRFKKVNKYMFTTGMTLVFISIALQIFIPSISTVKQQDAIHNIKARATKEGNQLIIHSESKWINDGTFEIVGENDTHYFIKDGPRVIEVNKLEADQQ